MKYFKDSEFVFFFIKDSHSGTATAGSSTKSFQGLARVITIGLNSPTMITQNIDVRANLANGSMGTVIAFLSFDDNSDALSMDREHVNVDEAIDFDVIVVDVPGYCGVVFTKGHPKWVPIFRRSVSSGGGQRTQFPLVLAANTSIHKAQGRTMDKGFVDIGEKEFSPGLGYVGLRRVRTLEKMWIKRFSWERYKQMGQRTPDMEDKLFELDMLTRAVVERRVRLENN